MVAETAAIVVDIEPARGCPDLAAEWRALEGRADLSFFQSWLWIGTWLAELPVRTDPLRLRARLAGETVGLALLTPCRARRHRVLAARQLHLNATGVPAYDRLTIEHNGFVVDRRFSAAVTAALLHYLRGRPDLWEELVLPGVDPALERAAGALGCKVIPLQRSRCPYVDFAALGSGGYIDQLGRDTRYQIRRAHRLYGNPEIEPATGGADARAFLAGLCELHGARWRAVGEGGAFADDFLAGFHARLVAEGTQAGSVQLLRTRAGDGRTIGYLYNFLHRRRVYAYQSGFERPSDNRLKPGLVSHHLAIEMNRAAGQDVYDFLAGDSRYKRCLSNRESKMIWLMVQRPALKFAIENGGRAIKALIRR